MESNAIESVARRTWNPVGAASDFLDTVRKTKKLNDDPTKRAFEIKAPEPVVEEVPERQRGHSYGARGARYQRHPDFEGLNKRDERVARHAQMGAIRESHKEQAKLRKDAEDFIAAIPQMKLDAERVKERERISRVNEWSRTVRGWAEDAERRSLER